MEITVDIIVARPYKYSHVILERQWKFPWITA